MTIFHFYNTCKQQTVASTQICCPCSFCYTSVSRVSRAHGSVTHDCHVQGLAGKSLFKGPKTLAIWNFLGLQIPRIGIVIIIIKTIFILGDKYGCSFVAKISKWHLHTTKMNYRYLGNDFFFDKRFSYSINDIYIFNKWFLYPANDFYIQQEIYIFSNLKFVLSTSL